MFSSSTGNVSWLLAEPCLLPLLHSSFPGAIPLRGAGLGTVSWHAVPWVPGESSGRALGKGELPCVLGQQRQGTKGFLNLFSPREMSLKQSPMKQQRL